MYNLDEQFMTKSVKQITNMVRSRIEKDRAATETIAEWGDYVDMHPKYERMVKEARAIEADVMAWMQAAEVLFSAEKWDDIIIEAGGCLECWGSEA